MPHWAGETLALIRAGGPLPHAGTPRVQHQEGLLPPAARGTCRKYAVIAPSRQDRGIRRIVAVKRAEFHYTKDHYNRFRRVIE